MSVTMSICLFVSLSLAMPIFLNVSFSMSICPYISLSVAMSIFLKVSLFNAMPICLYVNMSLAMLDPSFSLHRINFKKKVI